VRAAIWITQGASTHASPCFLSLHLVLQAGGLVSSCSPAGRRAHALAGVQGRFLLLHGGYSGSCELLQDTWLYDTARDCWMPVELQGEDTSGSPLPAGTSIAVLPSVHSSQYCPLWTSSAVLPSEVPESGTLDSVMHYCPLVVVTATGWG
jgi:hypothetical protein